MLTQLLQCCRKRKSALSKAASDVSPQKVFVAANNGPIKPQLAPQHLLHAPTDPGQPPDNTPLPPSNYAHSI